jgi:hypothetical protein
LVGVKAPAGAGAGAGAAGPAGGAEVDTTEIVLALTDCIDNIKKVVLDVSVYIKLL